MTAAAGWPGLVAGTLSAIAVFVLATSGAVTWFGDPDSQGPSFAGAGVAFVVDIAVSVAVSLGTRPKPDSELRGLVWSLTPRESRKHSTEGADGGWYRRPGVLAAGALVLTVVLNIIFW